MHEEPAIPSDLFPASPPDGLTSPVADIVAGRDQLVVPSAAAFLPSE